MRRLEGKVAIITGAASGIGRATARLFADEGAYVAVLDRNAAAAHETAAEVGETRGAALAWEVDLSGGAAEAAVQEVGRQVGRLDILVNNAATYLLRSFDEIRREEMTTSPGYQPYRLLSLRKIGGARDAQARRREYREHLFCASSDF